MYFLLRQLSFVRLLIPLVTGILIGIYIPFITSYKILAIINIILAVATLFALYYNNDFRRGYINGLLISTTVCCLGFSFSVVNTLSYRSNYFEKLLNPKSYNTLIVIVTEPPQEKENSLKAIAEIQSIDNGAMQNAVGKVQLYFSKQNASIKYGDIVALPYNKLQTIDAAKNPYEFDYKEFMSFKQVHHQAFLKPNDFTLLAKNKGNYLLSKIYQLREHLVHVLKQYVANQQSFQIASSLLLGTRETLDFQLIKAYSSSGAMHVLAVSGLHVAILFVILEKLLFFLNKNAHTQKIQAAIIIVIVWLYAFLTGFTPSVQRSAIMFTFIAVGKNAGRQYNIYNVLAASALFQLLLNPYTIMEVGFQLSYLAVLGIVMFQKIFTDLWYVKNKVLQYLWQITCVSVAAQLITFPIGLLYFYQFPTYFFISNLFVIPVSFVIMIVGFALLVVYPVPYVGIYLGKLLNSLIWFMNQSVFLTEQLPFSLIQGLSISIIESWAIYVIIFLAFAFIHTKRISLLVAMSVVFCLLFSWNTLENIMQYRQQKFVVYATPKSYAYDFIDGKKNLLIAPESLAKNYSQMQFHIMHNWWENDIRQHDIVDYHRASFSKGRNWFQQQNFIQFYNNRIVIIDSTFKYYSTKNKMTVDYLILQKSPKVKLAQLQKLFHFKMIVADGSNKKYKQKYWQQEADSLQIPFHNVNTKGAFVKDLKN